MKFVLGDLFFECVWDEHVLVLQCFCGVAGEAEEGTSSSLLASLLVWFTWVDLGGIGGRASGSECRTWEGPLVGERVAQTAVIMAPLFPAFPFLQPALQPTCFWLQWQA